MKLHILAISHGSNHIVSVSEKQTGKDSEFGYIQQVGENLFATGLPQDLLELVIENKFEKATLLLGFLRHSLIKLPVEAIHNLSVFGVYDNGKTFYSKIDESNITSIPVTFSDDVLMHIEITGEIDNSLIETGYAFMIEQSNAKKELVTSILKTYETIAGHDSTINKDFTGFVMHKNPLTDKCFIKPLRIETDADCRQVFLKDQLVYTSKSTA